MSLSLCALGACEDILLLRTQKKEWVWVWVWRKGQSEACVLKLTLTLAFVPRTGIEPALPCDNQILSLARLPVPPSGHFAPRCSAGCNITLSAEFCQNTIEVFFLVVILFYLQHCFLGNRIDLIHFQIVFNRFQDFILYSFNLI